MGHIEAQRELPARVDAVWAMLADASTWADWFTIDEKWLCEVPRMLTEGTRLAAKIVMLGMANKIECGQYRGATQAVDERYRYGGREMRVHVQS